MNVKSIKFASKEMKRALLLLTVFSLCMAAAAQRLVTGKVVDQDSNEAVIQATAALLQGEKLVANALTNMDGGFSIKAPRDGSYTLKVTYVGFKTYSKKITLKDGKNHRAGTIKLEPDAIMLKGATVTARASKVTMKADTFIYNATAFRTPEGSVVEELVKRLPGAEVSDDGTIKINGKEVKKILVDGKEFMTGDTKTALQNLPTNIIERIRSYDQQSDLSRVSGIQDGEEETVLDFGVKKGMNKGYISNIDLGLGTENRYANRGMGAYMQDNTRVMLFARANNVNDRGFPGGGGGRWGGQRQGLNAMKMLGANFNYEKKDKLKLNGSVRWNHQDGDQLSRKSTEDFTGGTSSSFSNSLNQNFSRSNSWNGQMRIEWQPDSMTNILFRPNFNYNSSDGLSNGEDATFNEDPYQHVTNPLEELGKLVDLDIVKNYRLQTGLSYSDNKRVGGMLQFNRKLNNKGRNLTLQLNGNWNKGDSKSMSTNFVSFFQLLNSLGEDSTYQSNRYSLTPTTNWDYRARVTYSEPIFKQVYLQFSYQYQYRYTKSDRSTYDLVGVDFSDVKPDYRTWDLYLNRLTKPLNNYLDDDLSRFSEYKNYIHRAELMLRIVRKGLNFNAGVQVIPQKSHFIQDYQGVHSDTTRVVTNITPTLDFRWKRTDASQLRFNYRGQTSQPSMSDLLDITDDSDPLNVRKGNPGLKPSFSQRFNLFYNNYVPKHQRSIATWIGFNTTSNSISNKVTYDKTTGGRTTRPENIDGNWNGWAGLVFNTAIDSAGYFNINTFTNVGYNHNVGYVSPSQMEDSQKSVTKATTLSERLAASFRNEWLEFELNGSVNYTHSRNDLQPNNNLDTWQFSYGGMIGITAPWGTSLNTNLDMQSRRGYNDSSMNTNELIWNAQISQSFLKGRPLTISLQLYDILREQSTVSRALTAIQRADTEYNSITSYAMLHVIYRLNLFGGKSPFGGPGGRPGGGPGGGRRPGGFGGGRRW